MKISWRRPDSSCRRRGLRSRTPARSIASRWETGAAATRRRGCEGGWRKKKLYHGSSPRKSAAKLLPSVLSIPAQQREDEQEHVEQVEIDAHRGDHVVIGPVQVPHPPRVEHEKSAEEQDADAGDPGVS